MSYGLRTADYGLMSYVTLALAGLCLFVAEQSFIPTLWMGLPAYLGLLGLAWYSRDRWRLPLWGSNVLGILIALGTIWWLWIRMRDNEGWGMDIPVTARLVPYLGPVTMALLLVRLFGGGRAGDFWLIQGMGLLQAALGCVLATGPLFGVLLLAYLVSGLALLRRQQFLRRLPAAGEEGTRSNSGRALSLLLWSLAVAGVALPFYLLTPRSDDQEWDPFRRFGVPKNPTAVIRTGHSAEIDLTRIGHLERDERVAFSVMALGPDEQPKTDLPSDQRWRGGVLESYDSLTGHWTGRSGMPQMGMRRRLQVRNERVEEPPGAFHLIFTVQPRRAGGLFLADPIPPGKDSGALPVRILDPRDTPPLFSEQSGTVIPFPYLTRPEYRYSQAVAPSARRDRYRAERLRGNHLNDAAASEPIPQALVSDRVPGLAEWTRELLQGLIEQKGWEKEWQLPVRGAGEVPGLPESRWQAAALLLTEYLAHSGEYFYTLDLRREDLTIDPVMDFLVNLKQGHCERYASALTMMLRSQGIPARLVKGFRGAEHQGDGVYLVRQYHAHAWVEALVPRNDPNQAVFDWLVLDPTPDRDETDSPGFSLARLWLQGQQSGQELWRDLVLEYNAHAQASVWALLRNLGERWMLWLGLGLTSLALAGLLAYQERRKRQRKRNRPVKASGLFGRLVALFDRPGRVRREVGQTAREWAEDTERWLGRSVAQASGGPATAEPDRRLITVPGRVVALFYRERYGGVKPTSEEEQELGAVLEELARVLP